MKYLCPRDFRRGEMEEHMKTVVIGSGSWGTALAQVLCDNGQDVILYGNCREQIEDIEQNHRNSMFFEDVQLHPDLHATLEVEVVADADIIVLSVPTIAITLGTIGLLASNALMTVNVAFVHMADRYIETGETKRLWIYNWLLPQLVSALFYGVPAFICVYFGADVFENLMSSLPTQVNNALNVVGSVLPALGIGMMFKAVYKKKFIAFAIIGFVLIAYLELDIIACTLVGVAAAILYWSLGLDKLTEGENSNE